MKWTNVKDELPVLGKSVLFATKSGFVGEGYWSSRNRWLRYGDTISVEEFLEDTVVAWMKLPEYY